MRNHRLFAAGLAAALMLGGAASPALAKPGNGKGYGKDNAPGHTEPKPNPPKGPKPKKINDIGVSGGGKVSTGDFSIQARTKHYTKGHFNFDGTDGSSVRCRGFSDVLKSVPGTVTVTSTNCDASAAGQPARHGLTVAVTVTDNGQPKSAVADVVTFTISDVPGVTFGGPLTGGNVKVRFAS